MPRAPRRPAPVDIPRWPTVEMALADLDPAPWNPRAIAPERLGALRAALQRFGAATTLTWNRRDRTLLGGHQRLRALRALGVERGDVTVVDLPPAEAKALAVELNSVESQGHFTAALNVILEEIRVELPDVHTILRFEELPATIISEDGPREGGASSGGGGGARDQLPSEPAAILRRRFPTRMGQAWIIPSRSAAGQAHRIAIGDPTDPAVSAMALGGRRPALAHVELPEGREEAWEEAVGLSGADTAIAWHPAMRGAEARRALEASGLFAVQQIVWVRPPAQASRASAGAPYAWRHETAWLAARPGQRPSWAAGEAAGETTCWEEMAEEGARPRSLPAAVHARAARLHATAGDAVYLPFCGAGAAMAGCEAEGRVGLAVCEDPLEAAVALARIADAFGLAPTLDAGEPADAGEVEATIEGARGGAESARRPRQRRQTERR